MVNSELITQWCKDVADHASEVDPGSEEDWGSLALGYALGKGLTPDEAHELCARLCNEGLV